MLGLHNQQEQDQEETELTIPINAGPALLGKEPLFGSFRRSLGLPVLRDTLLTGAANLEPDVEEEPERFPGLPDNIIVNAEDPDPEALAIAQEHAGDAKRIFIEEDGRVRRLGHGSGGQVVLRERQDPEITLEKDLTIDPTESQRQDNTTSTVVRTMSAAANQQLARKGQEVDRPETGR